VLHWLGLGFGGSFAMMVYVWGSGCILFLSVLIVTFVCVGLRCCVVVWIVLYQYRIVFWLLGGLFAFVVGVCVALFVSLICLGCCVGCLGACVRMLVCVALFLLVGWLLLLCVGDYFCRLCVVYIVFFDSQLVLLGWFGVWCWFDEDGSLVGSACVGFSTGV